MKQTTMKILVMITYLILCINISITSGNSQDLLSMKEHCPKTKCQCQLNQSKGNILNCRDKQLTQIPVFSNVNVTFFELTFSTAYPPESFNSCRNCNRITTILSGAFANLKVMRIDLTKNYISNFSAGSFAGLENILEELLIEGNGQISIPFQELKNLNQLTFLQIRNFRQSTITSSNSIWNFTKLTRLELYTIKDLTHIDENTFQNRLPKLTSLLIDDVPLSYLPVLVLSKLKLLTSLTIKNTKITNIYNQSFTSLTQLKELVISHNSNLMNLDGNCSAGIADTLQFLDLEHNNLSAKHVAKAFSVLQMTKLEILVLTNSLNENGLDKLPGKTFQNLPRLLNLDLERNKIKELDAETFYGLGALQTLKLSFNAIKVIKPSLFSFSPTLENLVLNNQNINDKLLDFPTEAIFNIKNSLKSLDLEGNHLNSSQIWKIVEQLPKLKELNLTKTNLKSIPDFVFKHSHSLEKIDLKDNNILQLSSASFCGLQDTLKEIDLTENNLTIDKCVFNNFTEKLKIVSTWHCDCRLLWLLDIINKGEHNYHEDTCSSPESLKDTFLTNLTADQLHCPSNYTEFSCPTYNCSVIVTQPCDTSTTPDTAHTTSISVTNINLSIISKEAYKITLAWDASMDRSSITGFVLQYKSFEENINRTMKLHRETFHYTLEDLKPNTNYKICIYVEINKTIDTKSPQCMWEKTKNVEASDSQNLSSSMLIGIYIGGALFVIVILASVIIFIVVKCNILKKKTDDQNGGYAAVQDIKVSVIPNNYTNLRNLPQSSCLNDRYQGMQGHELAQSNSAPSSLNAGQLLRSTSDPNRPLPEIPIIPGPSDACNVAATSVSYKENTDQIYIDFCK